MLTNAVAVPSHLWLDERGRAWIDDKNLKVIEVVEALMVRGWSVQRYLADYDNYLTLGQVHAALSHYYDHKAEYDAEIERQRLEYELLRAESIKSPESQRLRAKVQAFKERS